MNEPNPCEACKHYKLRSSDPVDHHGFCRRYPPQVIPVGDDLYTSASPQTPHDETCGEFSRADLATVALRTSKPISQRNPSPTGDTVEP